MQKWYVICVLLLIFFVYSAGCSSPPPVQPTPTPTPAPLVLPTPESKTATVPPSDMALQLSDMNSDYIIKDRSVMISPEVTQLTRDLGWRQGYFVQFYRLDKDKDDQTFVRQSVNIFPLDNMEKVFSTEKEDMKSRTDGSAAFYEIPFPTIGERNIAFRGSYANDPNDFVVYSVLFTKKNVYEKITMTGSTTDYETLKVIAQKAAEKIR
ncbi:MAG: hypothetical protein WC294_01050 [Methanoregula sp.]|jgi:hypothetical protein